MRNRGSPSRRQCCPCWHPAHTCLCAAVAWCCVTLTLAQNAVALDPKLSNCLQQTFKHPCDSTTAFSYKQTYDMVTDMVQELSKPQLSWAVGWNDLADSDADTDSSGSMPRPTRIEQASTAGPLLKQLLTSLNEGHDSSSRLCWSNITAGVLANVKALAAWWSSEQEPSLQASVVTFGSLERLQQLRAQCMHWRGPLSVAVYMPILQAQPGSLSQRNKEALRLAVLKVMHLAADLERHASTACQLSLVLVYEIIQDEPAMPLYPLNSMRNLARMQARTPMAVLLDVDLLPSKSLYTRLAQPDKAQDLLQKVTSGRTVYIIPAFELAAQYDTVAWADALSSAPNKDVMRKMMDVPVVQQFHGRNFARGHRLTRYTKWRENLKDDYPTKYEIRCEPWVLGPTFLMPWSDERYRGWGNNKIQFVNSLYHAGFNFMVMHDAYTIHRPHAIAATMQKYTRVEGSKVSLKPYIDGLWHQQVARFKKGTPWSPHTSQQLQNVVAKLSWWQGASTRTPSSSTTR